MVTAYLHLRHSDCVRIELQILTVKYLQNVMKYTPLYQKPTVFLGKMAFSHDFIMGVSLLMFRDVCELFCFPLGVILGNSSKIESVEVPANNESQKKF